VLFVGTFGFKGFVAITRAVTHAHAHTCTHNIEHLQLHHKNTTKHFCMAKSIVLNGS